MPVDEKVELLNEWICMVSDDMLRNPHGRAPKHVAWRMNILRNKRREVVSLGSEFKGRVLRVLSIPMLMLPNLGTPTGVSYYKEMLRQ